MEEFNVPSRQVWVHVKYLFGDREEEKVYECDSCYRYLDMLGDINDAIKARTPMYIESK